MNTVIEIAPRLGPKATCEAFGVSRATYYRKRMPMHGPWPRRPAPARRISDHERKVVLDVLQEERFADVAPAEVHATLLDEGQLLCSVRSMHRILAECFEVRDRRNQLRHPSHARVGVTASSQVSFRFMPTVARR